jgi:hypothetical protein
VIFGPILGYFVAEKKGYDETVSRQADFLIFGFYL